jgi:hypothetical protein
MNRLIAVLMVASVVVAVVWYAIATEKTRTLNRVLEREGFTEITINGSYNGSDTAYWFQARNKFGSMCRGYVSPMHGGVYKVITHNVSEGKN